MSDVAKPTVLHGEVIPSGSHALRLGPNAWQLPQGLVRGSSFFATWRYANETRQLEAYNELVQAKNALLQVLHEQIRLTLEFEYVLERWRNVDVLREAARVEAQNQLALVRGQGELQALRIEDERQSLLLSIEQKKKARGDLGIPPAPQQGPKTTAQMVEDVAAEVDEIMKAAKRARDEWVNREGGEGNLNEDARRRLDEFDLACEQAVQQVLGKLVP